MHREIDYIKWSVKTGIHFQSIALIMNIHKNWCTKLRQLMERSQFFSQTGIRLIQQYAKSASDTIMIGGYILLGTTQFPKFYLDEKKKKGNLPHSSTQTLSFLFLQYHSIQAPLSLKNKLTNRRKFEPQETHNTSNIWHMTVNQEERLAWPFFVSKGQETEMFAQKIKSCSVLNGRYIGRLETSCDHFFIISWKHSWIDVSEHSLITLSIFMEISHNN